MGIASPAPLRPEIEKSWRRARMYGVDPVAPGRLSVQEVDRKSRLMRVAVPVVDELFARLSDHSLCLILADEDCRVVRHWSGDRDLRKRLERSGVAVGIALDEGSAGTNGLGTALETGHGVSINGSEHYLHVLKGFSCYGQPIRHPLTRRVEGVLDITAEGAASNPLFGPLLQRAVRDIEAALVDGARECERRLFHAFQGATRKRSTPVAVLSADIVLANRSCLERLGDVGPSVLRILLDEVTAKGRASRTLDLGETGRVHVEAERIEGTLDGALFHLAEPEPDPARPVSLTGPVELGQGPVLVAGEPGSGRTTAARREAAGEPVVIVDCAEAVAGCERAWAVRISELAATHTGVLLVEDIHVLPENLCAVVRRAIGSTSAARAILTSCPVSELPTPAARLSGACPRRVEIAPLRERTHEIPGLMAGMGATARPGRDVRLTPRALEALCAYPWPGNLTELAHLVAALTTRPAAGWVDLPDLPAQYWPSGRARGLGGRERAERNAIINALGATSGNKVRTAEQLGISRTTLYRRMRALGVHEGLLVGFPAGNDGSPVSVHLCNSRRPGFAESSPHFKARRGT